MLKVSDPSISVMVSLYVSLPIFVFILWGMGQIREIGAFPLQAYLWLGGAGIIHFLVGRGFLYQGVRMVGANMANVFVSCGPIYSVVAGILFFDELLTWQMVFGIALILAGILFLAWGPRGSVGTQTLPPGLFLKGMFSAMTAGLIFGLTPVLIKLGLASHGSPVAATLVSHAAASGAILGLLAGSPARRRNFFGMGKEVLMWFCLGGASVAMAQLFRYVALSMSPMSIVAPIIGTSPLFSLFFSFFINRNLETFTPRVILGAVAVVAGTVILFGF